MAFHIVLAACLILACDLCVVPENIHTLSQKGLEFPGRGGVGGGGEWKFCKARKLREMSEA